jgi:hypothetical protein
VGFNFVHSSTVGLLQCVLPFGHNRVLSRQYQNCYKCQNRYGPIVSVGPLLALAQNRAMMPIKAELRQGSASVKTGNSASFVNGAENTQSWSMRQCPMGVKNIVGICKVICAFIRL